MTIDLKIKRDGQTKRRIEKEGVFKGQQYAQGTQRATQPEIGFGKMQRNAGIDLILRDCEVKERKKSAAISNDGWRTGAAC